jgi:hypothetical protein
MKSPDFCLLWSPDLSTSSSSSRTSRKAGVISQPTSIFPRPNLIITSFVRAKLSQTMAQKNNMRLGEQVWSKMPKVNAELLTLTYGSLIMQVELNSRGILLLLHRHIY